MASTESAKAGGDGLLQAGAGDPSPVDHSPVAGSDDRAPPNTTEESNSDSLPVPKLASEDHEYLSAEDDGASDKEPNGNSGAESPSSNSGAESPTSNRGAESPNSNSGAESPTEEAGTVEPSVLGVAHRGPRSPALEDGESPGGFVGDDPTTPPEPTTPPAEECGKGPRTPTMEELEEHEKEEGDNSRDHGKEHRGGKLKDRSRYRLRAGDDSSGGHYQKEAADGDEELDYEDDEDAEQYQTNLKTSVLAQSPDSKDSQSKAKKGKESETEEGEASDDDEEDDGEIRRSQSKDGELDEDMEDGEIKEEYGRRPFKRYVCRFFLKGNCTWGYACKFLHPGVNDKGNYSLIDIPGLTKPFNAARIKPSAPTAPAADSKGESEGNKEAGETGGGSSVRPPAEPELVVPPPPPEMPRPETSWERGLRQAREAVKRATRKKELEPDLETKKLTISAKDLENKENVTKYKDPYYDGTDDFEEEPAAPAAMEEKLRQQLRAGHFENFEVRWTRENYTAPYGQAPERPDGPMPPPSYRRNNYPPGGQYPNQRGGGGRTRRDSEDDRRYRDRRHHSRGRHRSGAARYSPDHPSKTSSAVAPASRGGRGGGMMRGGGGGGRADEWHDPWQRSRGHNKGHDKSGSASPPRRRGSASSDSSQSSYSSRSRSSSYSSHSSSSRSSSQSSDSSRSEYSRSRSPPPSRDGPPGLPRRGDRGDAPHPRDGGKQPPVRGPQWAPPGPSRGGGSKRGGGGGYPPASGHPMQKGPPRRPGSPPGDGDRRDGDRNRRMDRIPRRPSPRRSPPRRTPPRRMSPRRTPPRRMSPRRTPPRRMSPRRTPPRRMSPRRTPPRRTPPRRPSPPGPSTVVAQGNPSVPVASARGKRPMEVARAGPPAPPAAPPPVVRKGPQSPPRRRKGSMGSSASSRDEGDEDDFTSGSETDTSGDEGSSTDDEGSSEDESSSGSSRSPSPSHRRHRAGRARASPHSPPLPRDSEEDSDSHMYRRSEGSRKGQPTIPRQRSDTAPPARALPSGPRELSRKEDQRVPPESTGVVRKGKEDKASTKSKPPSGPPPTAPVKKGAATQPKPEPKPAIRLKLVSKPSAVNQSAKKRVAEDLAGGPAAKRHAGGDSDVAEDVQMEEEQRLDAAKTSKSDDKVHRASDKPASPTPSDDAAQPEEDGPSESSATGEPSAKRPALSRREELLKQLRQVEDAIARKRSKV